MVKDKIVQVRISAADKRLVERAAKKTGMTPSTFVRNAAVALASIATDKRMPAIKVSK